MWEGTKIRDTAPLEESCQGSSCLTVFVFRDVCLCIHVMLVSVCACVICVWCRQVCGVR